MVQPAANRLPRKAPGLVAVPVGQRQVIKISQEHHIALAQQASRQFIQGIGFEGMAVYYVITAVSELASNLVFYASRGGSITLRSIKSERGELGVEVISEDDGPGIEDINLALQDGFSTRGGLGGGLPGVKKLTDEFEVTSTLGIGTRIVFRKRQYDSGYGEAGSAQRPVSRR